MALEREGVAKALSGLIWSFLYKSRGVRDNLLLTTLLRTSLALSQAPSFSVFFPSQLLSLFSPSAFLPSQLRNWSLSFCLTDFKKGFLLLILLLFFMIERLPATLGYRGTVRIPFRLPPSIRPTDFRIRLLSLGITSSSRSIEQASRRPISSPGSEAIQV